MMSRTLIKDIKQFFSKDRTVRTPDPLGKVRRLQERFEVIADKRLKEPEHKFAPTHMRSISQIEYDDTKAYIGELENDLKIATEALEQIVKEYCFSDSTCNSLARDALEKIKGEE